jgi:hypothetical protein
LCWVFFFFFDRPMVGTKGFRLARQVLYHLSHSASPSDGYFWDRVSWIIYPGWPWRRFFVCLFLYFGVCVCVVLGLELRTLCQAGALPLFF